MMTLDRVEPNAASKKDARQHIGVAATVAGLTYQTLSSLSPAKQRSKTAWTFGSLVMNRAYAEKAARTASGARRVKCPRRLTRRLGFTSISSTCQKRRMLDESLVRPEWRSCVLTVSRRLILYPKSPHMSVKKWPMAQNSGTCSTSRSLWWNWGQASGPPISCSNARVRV